MGSTPHSVHGRVDEEKILILGLPPQWTIGGCTHAGLVKVMLAGETRVLPGNLHFSAPNPASAGLASGALRVVATNTAWPGSVAAISSFGFGGSNAHVLLRCGAPAASACQAVHSAPHAGDACSSGATEVAGLGVGLILCLAEPARAPGAGGAPSDAGAGSAPDQALQLPLASRTREGLERLAAAVRQAGTQLTSSPFPSYCTLDGGWRLFPARISYRYVSLNIIR